MLDQKIAYMEEHIENILERNLEHKNPDITEEIFEKLVNGGPREHTMALAQLYWNAADRMRDWDVYRELKYNSRPLVFAKTFDVKVREYIAKSHKYRLLHHMVSFGHKPDRAVIEYTSTSEDEI